MVRKIILRRLQCSQRPCTTHVHAIKCFEMSTAAAVEAIDSLLSPVSRAIVSPLLDESLPFDVLLRNGVHTSLRVDCTVLGAVNGTPRITKVQGQFES